MTSPLVGAAAAAGHASALDGIGAAFTPEIHGALGPNPSPPMSADVSSVLNAQSQCNRCGKPSQPGMKYCLFCGASLPPPPPVQPAQQPAAPATAVQVPTPGSFGTPSPGGVVEPPGQQLLEQRLIARGELEPNVELDRPRRPGPPMPSPGHTGVVPTAGTTARLVTIARDGAEGASYPLSRDQVDIGREEGMILLRDDPYISPRHVRITRREDGYYARDLESLNGFFIRLREAQAIEHGDLLLVGLQVLRFEVVKDGEQGFGPASQDRTLLFGSPMLPRYARLTERTVEGIPRGAFYLHREETILGREAGDIVFTDDPFMSRRHLAIRFDPKARVFTALDLESSNGTYLAARGETKLNDGDFLRMGQHLFRFEYGPPWPSRAQAGGARRSS